ncbi:MAG: UbiA family prenyltransferase [Galbitalea sp.]
MSGADRSKPPKLAALALASHPGPSVAVTLITVGLGFGAGLDAVRLLFLGLAMLAGQLSVGWSNDWIDARADAAVGRTDKPTARGWITARAVRNRGLDFRRTDVGARDSARLAGPPSRS